MKNSKEKTKEKMEAYLTYTECILKYHRGLLRCVGLDIYAEKVKHNAITFFIYFLLIIVFIMQLYTFLNYGNLEKTFCLFIFLLQFQVSSKILPSDIVWIN